MCISFSVSLVDQKERPWHSPHVILDQSGTQGQRCWDILFRVRSVPTGPYPTDVNRFLGWMVLLFYSSENWGRKIVSRKTIAIDGGACPIPLLSKSTKKVNNWKRPPWNCPANNSGFYFQRCYKATSFLLRRMTKNPDRQKQTDKGFWKPKNRAMSGNR